MRAGEVGVFLEYIRINVNLTFGEIPIKKLFPLVLSVVALLLLFGCSETPPTKSSLDYASYELVERPEFVETRPPEVVAEYILTQSDVPSNVLYKGGPAEASTEWMRGE